MIPEVMAATFGKAAKTTPQGRERCHWRRHGPTNKAKVFTGKHTKEKEKEEQNIPSRR